MHQRQPAPNVTEAPDVPGRRLSRAGHRIIAGTPEDMAGTIFGAILVLAVIAVGSSSRGLEPWLVAELAAGTTVVFWLAHVYAHALGESVELGRRIDWSELVAVARRQASIPLAAVAPVAALCLGGLGLLSGRAAVWLSMPLKGRRRVGTAFGRPGIALGPGSRLGASSGPFVVVSTWRPYLPGQSAVCRAAMNTR